MNEHGLELTWKDIESMEDGTYQLVDIRNEASAAYGMLPGAINIPEDKLEEGLEGELPALPSDKKVILYCTKGIFSRDMAEQLRELGVDAYSLTGGYMGWLLEDMKREQEKDAGARELRQRAAGQEEGDQAEQKQDQEGGNTLTKAEEVEKSIRKRFHKELFSRFARGINDYELVQENDRIAVCISGGKDSMLMAKLFQELKRHNKFHFELVFLVMDPGYSAVNRQVIENNARLLNIPITIFESDIFEAVYDVEKSPCYLCARMRRGYLYSKAKELGCNKIALGHHYDDVIETILMGMLYGGQVQTMMPKLHSTNFEGMELIRPMYLIREEDIKRWRDYNHLHFIQCACRFTENCATCSPDGIQVSKRMEVKHLIAEMKRVNPFVESNIFKSVENVNLSTIIAYKDQGKRHHFLERYGGGGAEHEAFV
ncbi:MAG: ATP-binding protein [Lachnospiraceae bacterium]|nr:ATP-binding protein [Lachnospiraceae bacterium]